MNPSVAVVSALPSDRSSASADMQLRVMEEKN